MGLFALFKSKEEKNSQTNFIIEPVKLAHYLFDTLSGGLEVPANYKEIVSTELKACDINNNGLVDRQTLLLRIIDLVNEPKTPEQRYLLAMAYSWSHTEYRLKAIEYLNIYLSNEIYEGAFDRIWIPNDNDNPLSWVSPINQHLSTMYCALGDAYLGENLYEEALHAYQKANEFAPSYASTYCSIAKVYVHMNELQKALSVFEDAKNTPYYSRRQWYDKISGKTRDIDFWKSIDRGEAQIKEKIQKGYVFRPRAKKQ